MSRSRKLIAAAVVGLTIACPVGYAVGSDNLGDPPEGNDPLPALHGYGGIPEADPAEGAIEGCERAMETYDPDQVCEMTLKLWKLKETGVLEPGIYPMQELRPYLESTTLP